MTDDRPVPAGEEGSAASPAGAGAVGQSTDPRTDLANAITARDEAQARLTAADAAAQLAQGYTEEVDRELADTALLDNEIADYRASRIADWAANHPDDPAPNLTALPDGLAQAQTAQSKLRDRATAARGASVALDITVAKARGAVWRM